ncbi:hypothetical protein B2G71_08510 [Novosphingobium sp. PC22D]|uniref:amine dehydrogenase large subunit n=1 Tax=Novosphingobium sp. PC22D TaxID=1962403 RepID=UPI000BF05789|nr:amine dehydrogenase large subunit [Novosphingobium sp. PC22D]PEQ12880.1 hypothetical protein B2G71_08510 [Novosphingobium sp. PC22D]
MTRTPRRRGALPSLRPTAALWLALGIAAVPGTATAREAAALEVEDSDVATIGEVTPRWVFLTSQWGRPGTRIVDGETGKMRGMVHVAKLSNFAADPAGKYFYVAETMWTKGNRGTRQDMITVRDSQTLEVVEEIPLQGRLLVGFRQNNFSVSADGRYAFVYNMNPASSVEVVDLQARKSLRVVEMPGCGLGAALPGQRFLSLCSNGALAVTSFGGGKAPDTQYSPVFFSADQDPVFDSSVVDAKSGKATFLSYTGKIYSVDLSQGIEMAPGWSLQETVGLPAATTAPIQVNWLPGGRQPLAVNHATGRAYVLMHVGEYWTQKEDGEEIWEVDLAARKVIARHPLSEDQEATQMAVSQDEKPLIYLLTPGGDLVVLDASTFEEKHRIKSLGAGGTMQTGLGR